MLHANSRIFNTIALTIGLCLGAAVLIPSAEAALTMNGVTINGVTINGVRLNGVNHRNINSTMTDADSEKVLRLEGGQLVLEVDATQP